MRTEDEIKDRLRELHGEPVEKHMGGLTAKIEAEALLWALGHNPAGIDVQPGERFNMTRSVDVSEYVEVNADE